MTRTHLTHRKQLTIAYLGTAFGSHSRKDTIISVTTTIATLIATVIAAIYIYYQMRLVMLRQPTTIPCLPTTMREMQALTVDLSDSTLGRRATLAAIKSAPHDKYGKGEMDEWYGELHARKPWLFGGRGYDENGLSRARSLPGPLSDDQVRWLASSDPSRADTPMVQITDRPSALGLDAQLETPAGTVDLGAVPSISVDNDDKSTATHVRVSSVSRSASPSPYFSPRAAMSLDLPRPVSDRLGGREIADDADMYAISRGARRPEYGRSRGESRAALLGRPDWDERSEMGSERSFKMHGRERGVSGSGEDALGVPPTPATGLDKGKEREYGRARGGSGAALLGRPDLDV